MSLAAFGLRPGATPTELKAAYRRLAQRAHPDRGGSTEAFQQLQAQHAAALLELEEGPGAKPDDGFFAPDPCPACGGKGKVPLTGGFSTLLWPCDQCGGTGRAP